jgi:hypothetical protein
MMKRPIYKSTTPLGALALGLFGYVFYYLAGGDEAHEIVNAIMCATSFGVSVAYLGDICRSLAKHPWEWEAEDAMMVGVFTLGLSLCVVFAGLWMYRLTDDIWYRTNVSFFIGRFFAVCGFAMVMTATRSVNGKLPKEAFARVGLVLAGAVCFALVMISLGYS